MQVCFVPSTLQKLCLQHNGGRRFAGLRRQTHAIMAEKKRLTRQDNASVWTRCGGHVQYDRGAYHAKAETEGQGGRRA